MRRAVVSLVALLALSACAHPQAGGHGAEGMAWSLDHVDGEGHKLAFGQPHSDNVMLMMTCQPRSGSVQVSVTAPPGTGADQLRLISSGRSSTLAATKSPSMGDGAILEAAARADDPVLGSFARSGQLAVAVGGRRTPLPQADQAQASRFVEGCRGA